MKMKALAGLGLHPYRRWGVSPRPENIGRPIWTTWANYAEVQRNRQEPSPVDRRMSAMPTDGKWRRWTLPAIANQIVNDSRFRTRVA
jgi:hypothetical protein